ncbi:hypothetical protein, variant 3 [Blastomyces dermatitidis ATCC 26199]|nr:hypothetical protein BDFG_04424 [Blastomyces dermatitidis ATCC 26199]EQL33693.1 hypothetical protein, variant 1 [Blastomyces dermatitidis ATCC 26199]EQL33694.1 hypothetical protein, variant 2 [Blastomyces dermatitidis ATCC 26199]EQL33695.1 hypothetical protein, variant 3 [Blastomyces dermatitidis ATCC 26199]
MQCDPLTDSFGAVSGRHGRSVSLSGDTPLPSQSMLSPPPVNPEPQFIAATAAAQIVSADQNLNGANPAAGTIGASVTRSSLTLLNRFLDNLLFNILMTAKSTKLNAIRPALAEVLKPRLAKEVVSAADEELSEYMGGGEDEELSDFRGGREPAGQFELERSWKLTRLRCMVYTRLGDMEEEDEEEHLFREGLNETDVGPARFSNCIGHITPAAAIFLTSILEYIGEHSLIIAGEAASTRVGSGRSSRARDEHSDTPDVEILVVEDMDMEKLALNPTLGRLWRMWRRNVRTPMLSRTLSRESMIRRGLFPLRGTSRASSIGTIEEPSASETLQKSTKASLEEDINPADIPIPVSENDVDEIEVPGFTTKLSIAVQARSLRPRSLLLSGSDSASPTWDRSASHSARLRSGMNDPQGIHSRSQSLPSSPSWPLQPNGCFYFGPNSATHSARDEQNHLETMIEDDELSDRLSGVRSSPPEIPPRSKQRQEPADTEDDAESSGHSEILSSAPTTQLHSPKFSNGILHHAELHSQRSQEKPIPQTHGPKQENNQPSEVPRAHRERMNNENIQDNREPKYQYRARVVTTVQKHAPECTVGEDGASRHSDQSNIQQAHAQYASSQDSIVETSFVTESNRAPFQSTRLSPHQEVDNVSSGIPDRDSPHSFFGAQSTCTTQSGQSVSRSNSRKHMKASNGGNTTPRYPPSSSVSVGSERAAVQRVSPPPPATPRDTGSKPRRSLSIGSHRDKRPITSGSTTSQVSNKLLKGLVGRQPSDHDSRIPFPIRTSTETNSTLSKFVEAVPDPTDLDQLIQSDETIHFTLTPRNMREMEDSNSPRWGATRNEIADMDEPLKTTSPAGETSEGRRPSVASSRLNAMRIHTPSTASPNKSKFVEASLAHSSRPQSSVHKTATPQARDARVERESLRDFAEFIRSTGPEQTTAAPMNHRRRTTSFVNGSSGSGNRKLSLTSSGTSSVTSSRPSHVLTKELPKKSAPRLEARPAVAPKDNGTSDLIDFIREGPPDGSHRIPRTVAPFRSTMDSDEFLLSPRGVHRDSGRQSYTPSSHADSTTTKSVPSSFNSRTGLLDSPNRANIRTQPGPSASGSATDTSESSMPARKQRRVKDPYAIDFDSDNDEFEIGISFGGLKAHKEEEESLADFLRHAPPPPELDQPPQLLSVNMNAASKARMKSTASMRTRLMRATSVDKVPSTKLSRSSLRSYKSNTTTVSSPPGPTAPTLETTRLKLSRSNSHINRSYSPPSSYRAYVESNSDGRANGAQRPQQSQPTAYQSSTAELADFLKSTGPPEPITRPASGASFGAEREKGNGSSFSRMFSRIKKQAV